MTAIRLILFSLLSSFFLYGFSPRSFNSNAYNNETDTAGPLFLKAKDHRSKAQASLQDNIIFRTALDNDHYLVDSPFRKGYFYIETSTLNNNSVQRLPLNISIVIDRSGSMQGIKMGYAKRAAKQIVGMLQPDDIVSIVVYDNYVDSVQAPVHAIDKNQINAQIDRIIPRGSTDLWGGTEKGYEYVSRNYRPGYINRVLLISDGQANVGLTDSSIICSKVQQYRDQHGMTISTFGVGLDYNEQLMTSMAESGSGNYYYIDAPEKLSGLFAHELSTMFQVTALDASIIIHLPKGIALEQVYPVPYRQEGEDLIIGLHDLFAHEVRGLLLQFRIDQGQKSTFDFETRLVYKVPGDGKFREVIHHNQLSPVKKPDDYLVSFNRNVLQQAILFSANGQLEQAMTAVDRGEYQKGKNLLTRNSGFLTAQKDYTTGSDELKRMDTLNRTYQQALNQWNHLPEDSIKNIQKHTREESYKIRNKKYAN